MLWHALCSKRSRTQPMSGDFNPEQKRYLEGFVAGLQIAKAARESAGASAAAGAKTAEPSGPRWPGMLHSSKDRAKPIVVDFVDVFRFRQRAFAAVLGSRRRLRRNSMQPRRLRNPDPCRSLRRQGNSPVFSAGHAETAGQPRAPCRGRTGRHLRPRHVTDRHHLPAGGTKIPARRLQCRMSPSTRRSRCNHE